MKKGYFGEFGGCFVPELLMPPLLEVEAAMRDIMPTQQFQDELQDLLHNYAGRPTPLTFCPRLSEELGFELWLKREDPSNIVLGIESVSCACCVTIILAQVETVVQPSGVFLAVSPMKRGPFFIICTKIIKLFPEG